MTRRLTVREKQRRDDEVLLGGIGTPSEILCPVVFYVSIDDDHDDLDDVVVPCL